MFSNTAIIFNLVLYIIYTQTSISNTIDKRKKYLHKVRNNTIHRVFYTSIRHIDVEHKQVSMLQVIVY